MDTKEKRLISPDVLQIQSSHNFRQDFILELIRRHTEGPLFDRKRSLPLLRDFRGNRLDKANEAVLDNIGEFIKDCLSMLNAARRRGKEGYIVYGINNDWQLATHEFVIENDESKVYKFRGAFGSFTRIIQIQDAINSLQNQEKFERLYRIFIEREDMRSRIEGFIDPQIHRIEFEFGWIVINSEDVFLCYLEFHPEPNDRAFIVRDMRPHLPSWFEKTKLSPGTTWIRDGESKKKISGADIDSLVSWRDTPYITKDEWEDYEKKLRHNLENRLQVSLSGLGPVTQNAMVGIQSIRVSGLSNGTVGDAIRNLLKDEYATRLFLLGNGGTGKTTSVIIELLEYCQVFRDDLALDARRDFPREFVPIYVPMGEYRSTQQTLSQYVAAQMHGIGVEKLQRISSILNDTQLRFLIVFDSTDENIHQNRQDTIDALLSFTNAHPTAKHIIVSRPGVFHQPALDAGISVLAQRWTLAEQIASTKAYHLPPDIEGKIITLLTEDIELQEMLSVPRFLDASMQGMRDAHKVSRGLIVQSAIDTVLQREEQRFGSPYDKMQLRYHIDSFVVECYPRGWVSSGRSLQIFEPTEFNTLIEAGLLVQSGAQIRFSNNYILSYVIAQQLLREEDAVESISEQITASPDKNIQIVEITANLTSREISDQSTVLSNWILDLTNPDVCARIVLNRLNPSLVSAGYWYQILMQMVEPIYSIIIDPNNWTTC